MRENDLYFITSEMSSGIEHTPYEFYIGAVDAVNKSSVRVRYQLWDGTTRKMTFSLNESPESMVFLQGAVRLNTPDKQIQWKGFSDADRARAYLRCRWTSDCRDVADWISQIDQAKAALQMPIDSMA